MKKSSSPCILEGLLPSSKHLQHLAVFCTLNSTQGTMLQRFWSQLNLSHRICKWNPFYNLYVVSCRVLGSPLYLSNTYLLKSKQLNLKDDLSELILNTPQRQLVVESHSQTVKYQHFGSVNCPEPVKVKKGWSKNGGLRGLCSYTTLRRVFSPCQFCLVFYVVSSRYICCALYALLKSVW